VQISQSKHFNRAVIILLAVLVSGCFLQHEKPKNIHTAAGPEWARDAVWYQIFPERFRNGDTTNDPTIETLAGTWPYDTQTYWQVTPWTDDWYKLQPWEEANGRGFYYNAQLRRYGGDLQGILDKLDYLVSLGVNAIYLNPVFESPSSHKYGATYYHHIDNNFGPDPAGDAALWKTENPGDPSTWTWTSADKLFLKLVSEVHKRDMRIIIDGVFNHVGIPFWALEDVRKNGKDSPYKNWFTITRWDDPATPEDEFTYEGWFGIRDLPELKEDENGLIPPIEEHIHAVVRRWMDPNGDGDPSDGIDGWRLDVADMVPLNFWRKFRSWTSSINPESYLTGEVWWKDYEKNIMFNAAPWLTGDAFDAVMNYRFGDAIYKFFLFEKKQISATDFGKLLNGFISDYGYSTVLQLQNLIGSHDNERFASACVNPDRWIDHANNVQYEKDYLVRKPNAGERQKQKIGLAFQFTFPGAPYVYYGDEVGMWGADDPDERKPMVWADLTYEDETHHPFGLPRPRDTVGVDQDLLTFYRQMIRLRREHKSLRRGSYEVLLEDNQRQIFAFKRELPEEALICVFNGSVTAEYFEISQLLKKSGNEMWHWQRIVANPAVSETDSIIPAKGFVIYVRQ